MEVFCDGEGIILCYEVKHPWTFFCFQRLQPGYLPGVPMDLFGDAGRHAAVLAGK